MKERLKLAMELARRSGELLRAGFGQVSRIDQKGENNLLTEYDLKSEQCILEGIRQAYPGDSILSEERGKVGQGAPQWLIDPLDGTTNFAHGIPIFAVSIAFLEKGRPALGVVYDPMRAEIYHARRGQGAWLNGFRLQVSQVHSLRESLLVTGFPYDLHNSPDNNLGHYADLTMQSRGVRRLGAAALDLAYVAAGRLEGFWEVHALPWDLGAGTLLVQEAGGQVTCLEGDPINLESPTSMVASNGHIHRQLLLSLNGCGKESSG